MLKLVAVIALALTLEGAFILHAVVASPGPVGAPKATVQLSEVRLSRRAVVASAGPANGLGNRLTR
jgi:hypothetical protein